MTDLVISLTLILLAVILMMGLIEAYNEGRRLLRCWRVQQEQKASDAEWAAREAKKDYAR